VRWGRLGALRELGALGAAGQWVRWRVQEVRRSESRLWQKLPGVALASQKSSKNTGNELRTYFAYGGPTFFRTSVLAIVP
jgi:hypothetical protein